MSAANAVVAAVNGRRLAVLRISLIVAAVTIGLALVDISLEKTEQNELAAQAIRADRQGQKLLQEHRAQEAVDVFRKAHTLERENTKYTLDLIQALMAAGRPADAQPLMADILAEESNNGEANLVAARLVAKEGHINAADSYYHRAIYGEWSDTVAQHQIAVRLELIDFLRAHGKQDEMLAELLPLQEQADKRPALKLKLAQLFIVAGAPARAEDVYRQLIKRDPKNAVNYAGLGEAELALGDFRAAHAAFSNAVAHDGDHADWRQRLNLSAQLSSMDPTLRWLSSEERYTRSRSVLQLATDDLNNCITNNPQVATEDARRLVEAASSELGGTLPKRPTNAMAESTLALAEGMWRARTSLCGSSTAPDEEALRLMMEKLAK